MLINELAENPDLWRNLDVYEFVVKIGKPAIPTLKQLMNHKNSNTRMFATFSLFGIGDRSLSVLIAGLKYDAVEVFTTPEGYGVIGPHYDCLVTLEKIINESKSIGQLTEIERGVKEVFKEKEEDPPSYYRIKRNAAELLIAINERKNELSVVDLRLEDIPKPFRTPKKPKGEVYRFPQKRVLAN